MPFFVVEVKVIKKNQPISGARSHLNWILVSLPEGGLGAADRHLRRQRMSCGRFAEKKGVGACEVVVYL